MKAMCHGRAVRFEELPDVAMDGIPVMTQRQKKESERDARHVTSVFLLMQRLN